jgi:hypothetical protein
MSFRSLAALGSVGHMGLREDSPGLGSHLAALPCLLSFADHWKLKDIKLCRCTQSYEVRFQGWGFVLWG